MPSVVYGGGLNEPLPREWVRQMEDETRAAHGSVDREFFSEWREQPGMVATVAALLLMLLWWLFG